ncbi:ABC transporter ATP-binding protein [Corynebacterium hansenii]|uniref:ABC transporter ATP-binding protein n=1 Tax=Corynebacterium hansenii TaxID=394964 RepID=A0ABV7ZT30_9CORY|nr:ABC transporter ATP-binding protein [Corynebacterium hansenii]WJZ00977.1 Fe(3+) ions import ATP-binding protein FbpC 2 [Corynebacterium hansenii]
MTDARPQTPAPPALSISGLCAGYDGSPVLRDIDLEVAEGELLAVLGPSGCGKTTLLRVLAGLMPATAGTVHLAGRRVVDGPSGVPPERRRVGLVPQDASLFPHLDVADNVGFGLGRRLPRLPFTRRGRSVPDRVMELLEIVGIPELAHRMPSELSGGQAQRVSLARALAPNPDLVLLDEPFSALDAALRTRLRGEVREILAAHGATGLLVTHDQDEALSTADRVAIVESGRIIQCDAPEEVYSRPATAWVAGFVGTCSLLRGRVDGPIARSALGTAEVPAGTSADEVAVMVRPEQVALTRGDEVGAGTGTGTGAGVAGTVESVEYSGHSTKYALSIGEAGDVEKLIAREHGPARFAVGDRVTAAATSPLHAVHDR